MTDQDDDLHLQEMDTYEDEPMTRVPKSTFSGTAMVIENMDEVERKRQKRKRRRKKRLERLGKLAVVVCCAGVIAAIVVTIVFTQAAIAITTPAPPTLAPTHMPAVPTYKPTVPHPTAKVPGTSPKPPPVPTMTPVAAPTTPAPTLPVQDTYTLNPTQDTYVYTEGPYTSTTFGKDEVLLVQRGFVRNDDIPDASILLIFDTSSIPSFDRLATDGKKAVLKLYHKPADITDVQRQPAPIIVSRYPSTPVMIESVSGATFEIKNFWDGPTVEVPTDATVATFDITDLVFNDPFSHNQLFLMLQVRNQEQEVGDYFYSRESDTPPELIFTGMKP